MRQTGRISPTGPAANRSSPATSSARPPPSCARTGLPPWWRTSGGCASTQSGSCPQSVTRTSFSMAATCSRCRTLLRIPPSSTWRMRRCRMRRGPPPTCRCPRWSRPPPAYPSPASPTTPAQRAWPGSSPSSRVLRPKACPSPLSSPGRSAPSPPAPAWPCRDCSTAQAAASWTGMSAVPTTCSASRMFSAVSALSAPRSPGSCRAWRPRPTPLPLCPLASTTPTSP